MGSNKQKISLFFRAFLSLFFCIFLPLFSLFLLLLQLLSCSFPSFFLCLFGLVLGLFLRLDNLLVKQLLLLLSVRKARHETLFSRIDLALEVGGASNFGVILLKESVVSLENEAGVYFFQTLFDIEDLEGNGFGDGRSSQIVLGHDLVEVLAEERIVVGFGTAHGLLVGAEEGFGNRQSCLEHPEYFQKVHCDYLIMILFAAIRRLTHLPQRIPLMHPLMLQLLAE